MRRIINKKGDFAINQMMILLLLVILAVILAVLYGGLGTKIGGSIDKIIASADKFSQGVS